jgi:hypothetical protein
MVRKTKRSKEASVPSGHARTSSAPEPKAASSHGPVGAPDSNVRPIRSDIEGLAAVLEALERRQFDLYIISKAEWRTMTPRQRENLIKHQNRRGRSDHFLGPTYLMSPRLEGAVEHARSLYLSMTPEQRRKTLHPRHLDSWLENRRVITLVDRDLDDGPLPDYLLPASHRIPDEGPSPNWPRSACLTLALNLDASVQSVLRAVEDLVTAMHAPAARRPRRRSSARPTREKYEDDHVASMIDWYYRQAAGEPLKQLVAEMAGPTARHVDAMRTKILRQLRWFRRELGIA